MKENQNSPKIQVFTSIAQDPISTAMEVFISGRSPRTVESYKVDIRHFFLFLEMQGVSIEDFILLKPGEAIRIGLLYKGKLISDDFSPNTINRKLAAIRSFFKLCKTIGICDFELGIKNIPSRVLKDTRGPQPFELQKLFKYLHAKDDLKSIRDEAIFRLLFDHALRASELVGIDISDFDRDNKTISICGKGTYEKIPLNLSSASFECINRWIDSSQINEGPLFVNVVRKKIGCKRLTRQGLRDLVLGVSKQAGISLRSTHSWRHSSITQAIIRAQENGLGLELVLDHSRHSKNSINLLMTYRDRYEDYQGKIAEMVSKQIDSSRE